MHLFEILAEGPQSVADLARRLELQPDRATRLLDGAAALRLVRKRSNRSYGLGPLGAAMVGNDAVTAMISHHRMLYADLADPVGLLRGDGHGTHLSTYWAYARSDTPATETTEQVAAYTSLMATSQALVATEILDAYPVGRHRCLLDVGGGDGTFLQAAAASAPSLRVMLFDLPAVAALARSKFAASGLADRAVAAAGSFLTDSLPAGADLISLVRVVHDHDDAAVARLLHLVWLALPRGGTVLIAEPMAATPGATRMGDAYFGLYLLAMGSGRPRSAAELTTMLMAAGFKTVQKKRTSTPILTSVLVARKP